MLTCAVVVGDCCCADTRFEGFPAFADDAKMEDVVQAIAQKENYSEERWKGHLTKLVDNEIDEVGNLRRLSDGDVKDLGLPPVVTNYLQHVRVTPPVDPR